jgi:hypothetical protein
LVRAFVTHLGGSKPPQLVIYQREQFGSSARITLLCALENARHIAAGIGRRFGCTIAHGDRSVLLESYLI